VGRVTSAPAKKENLLINLVCNIALPTFVLSKLSTENRLGPVYGLILALLFPVGYGIYDYAQRRRANFISIVGFVSVLLTGGLGLMKVDGFWFAVKDAVVPILIGLGVLISLRSKTPIIREMFYNEQIVDVTRIDAALDANQQQPAFAALLAKTSVWLAGAFLISSVLNFALARYLLKSPSGTPEFNAELGKMHFWSWPVIVVPFTVVMMLAFWRLVIGLKKLTGLTADQIFRSEPPEPTTPKPDAG
jgi:hypothetical protein